MNQKQRQFMINLDHNLRFQRVADFGAHAKVKSEYFESTKRYAIMYEHDNHECKYLLSLSLDKNLNLTLHRIEIPEYCRRYGLAHDILQIIKDTLFAFDPNLKFIIKYPENKSFWKHYKEKYNPNLIFQYQ